MAKKATATNTEANTTPPTPPAGEAANTSPAPPATETKQTPPAPPSPPAETSKEKTVTVKCAVASLYEGGERYSKGDEFEVTSERAKALGKSITL